MLRSDSLNRNLVQLGIALILAISNQSCRKEIVHEPMSIVAEKNWIMSDFQPTFSRITSIEVYNNQLYLGGSSYGQDHARVSRLVGGQFVDFIGEMNFVVGGASFDDPIVKELAVIGNKLYIAGNFRYNDGVSATSFMTYDLNGNIEPIPLLSYNQTSITNVSEFNGDIIVCGNFGTSEPLVTSANIERIQSGTATGLASLQAPVKQSIEFNNILYAVGDDIQLQKWVGTTWVPEWYIGANASDEIYGVEVYNSELYLFGKFNNNVLIKKWSTSGDWQDYESVTNSSNSGSSSYNGNGGIVVLDDELYAYGRHIRIDDVNTSNIIKLEGNEWKNIGALQGFSVNDIAIFEGVLYCIAKDSYQGGNDYLFQF